jgi:peptide/nickel transport system substrate-binding protein
MLTRRTLLASAAAAAAVAPLATPALIKGAAAATPKNIVAMAKQIDDIIGAFDPAESYEFSNNEVCGNLYRKLVIPDPSGAPHLVGDIAEKWEVSKDGSTFTFDIRKGVVFESGKPLTAEDVAFSLQRIVKLNKTPGFILGQFGLTPDNVEQMVRATNESTVEMKLPVIQATSFVLYCLSATVGCVVEKATVMANQANGDLGNAWLKTHSAGAGSYRLVEWQASDHIILEANPHAAVKPHIPRAVIRHVADPSAQLLTLQKGDVDVARDLGSDQLKLVIGKPDYNVAKIAQLTSMYIGVNMGVAELKKVEVLQALKTAIDYEAIAKNITPNLWSVWQSFLPKGIPGAIADTPYKKDVAKAKALLAQAGYPNGFSLTLDHFAKAPYAEVAQAVQADLAAIGVKVQLLAGEQKQVIAKTRARTTQLALTTWFPDFLDPHSNAQAFCENLDDSDATKSKSVAWRYHFFDKELSSDVDAAVKELDTKKRMEIYAKMQREFLQRAPFIFMLQNVEIGVMHKGVSGLALGVLPDYTRYAPITKA